MIKAKALAALALAATVVLGAAPAGARQATKDDGDQVLLGTQEVLLDIVVTDGKGRPLTDLRRDEVKVYEDGEAQEITSFGLVQSDAATGEAAGSKPPPSIEASPYRGYNFIVVVVDRTSLSTPDLKATNDAAQKFVSGRLAPNDLVAVYVAANRLVLVQNFTNDKQKLSNALAAATDTGKTTVSFEQAARLGTQVDITAAAGEALPSTSASPAGSSAANALDTTAAQLTALSNTVDTAYADIVLQFESLAVVRELLALMKSYSRIPGRKSLVLYSAGLVVDDTVTRAFDSVIGTANRNNFAIYTVDAAGLRTEPQTSLSSEPTGLGRSDDVGRGGDRTLVDATGSSGIGRAERALRTGAGTALNRLAVETGGVPLRNNNDLTRGFQAVESDLRSYYALSYAPKNPDQNGKYRAIKVEVTRKDADVRTRKGYYATPGNDVFLPFEQPVLAMLADTKPGARPTDLPAVMSTDHFRSGAVWQVPVAVSLPASALVAAPPVPVKDKKDKTVPPTQFELDMVAVVRDAKGSVVAKTSRSMLYRSPQERVDAFKQIELANMFADPIRLPPGDYALSLAVYDPNSQKGTVIDRRLVLPPIAAGAPAASSLVLSRDVTPVEESERGRAATDPLVFNGTARITPNPSGRFVKSRNDRIFAYFRFYGAASKQYQARLELMRAGQIVSASSPTAMPVTSPSGETSFAPSIPASVLEPGTYTARLVVIDPETSQPVAITTADFRIDP